MALVTLEWGHTVQEEPIPYYRDKSNRKNTPLATHKSILGGSHTLIQKNIGKFFFFFMYTKIPNAGSLICIDKWVAIYMGSKLPFGLLY